MQGIRRDQRLAVQDVVWEQLDAINGDTVYVDGLLRCPGQASPFCLRVKPLECAASAVDH